MTTTNRCIWLLALACVAAVSAARADESLDKVRKAITARDAELQVAAVEKSPVSGLYLTAMEGTSGYITADGRYFIVGDMYELPSRKNVTEEVRQATRRELLQKVAPDAAITFAPAQPRFTITVFTDVDCPYCRKLHAEIAQLNELGIAVRYLAYPRSGPNTESWTKMQAVWCAKDRQAALTKAKLGEEVAPATDCHDTRVAEQYALGTTLAVQGTPMIVLEDGSTLGGYLPAARLLAEIEKHRADKAVASR